MRILSILTLAGFLAAASPATAKNPLRTVRNRVAGAIFGKNTRPVPAWLTNTRKPIAHRGLHGRGRPENSMAAFRAAVARGLPIELDIHLLADGKVAVFHDKTLDRMTSRTGKLNKLTSAEARQVRLKGGNGTIPMFKDVVKMVNGRVPILVELKGKSKMAGVKLGQAVMNDLKGYRGEIAVMGFSPLQVGWFRKHAPQIARGQVSGHFKKTKMPKVAKFMLKNMALDFLSRPNFIVHDVNVLPSRVVRFARESLKKPVLGYTVTSAEMAKKAKPHVDNIIFDPPYDPGAARAQ